MCWPISYRPMRADAHTVDDDRHILSVRILQHTVLQIAHRRGREHNRHHLHRHADDILCDTHQRQHTRTPSELRAYGHTVGTAERNDVHPAFGHNNQRRTPHTERPRDIQHTNNRDIGQGSRPGPAHDEGHPPRHEDIRLCPHRQCAAVTIDRQYITEYSTTGKPAAGLHRNEHIQPGDSPVGARHTLHNGNNQHPFPTQPHHIHHPQLPPSDNLTPEDERCLRRTAHRHIQLVHGRLHGKPKTNRRHRRVKPLPDSAVTAYDSHCRRGKAIIARAGHIQPRKDRLPQEAIQDIQVPFHGHRRRTIRSCTVIA